MNKAFWKAALIRAIRTVAQAALAMIPAAATLADVNWLTVLSTAALAGVVSVLTSIATGLPEAQIEERKPPDEEPCKMGVSGLFLGTKGAEEAEEEACQITIKAYTDYDEDGSPVVDGGGEDA